MFRPKTNMQYGSIIETFAMSFSNLKNHFMMKKKRNIKLKLEICKTAEIHMDSNHFNTVNSKFISLQKEWKSIGAVHQKDEQFLWNKFQK